VFDATNLHGAGLFSRDVFDARDRGTTPSSFGSEQQLLIQRRLTYICIVSQSVSKHRTSVNNKLVTETELQGHSTLISDGKRNSKGNQLERSCMSLSQPQVTTLQKLSEMRIAQRGSVTDEPTLTKRQCDRQTNPDEAAVSQTNQP